MLYGCIGGYRVTKSNILKSQVQDGHSTKCVTHAGHSVAFLHFCDPDLDLLTSHSLVGEVSWSATPVPSLVIVLSAVLFYYADKHTHSYLTLATGSAFWNFLTVTLTFNLMFCGSLRLVMDFSVHVASLEIVISAIFGFYRSDKQSNTQTRMNALLTRLPLSAWVITSHLFQQTAVSTSTVSAQNTAHQSRCLVVWNIT